MRKVFLAIFPGLLCAVFSGPIEAQENANCAALPLIVDELDEKWGESRVAAGLSAQGVLFQVFQSQSGTWTLVISDPTGRACALAAGTNWETYPIPKSGTEG